MVLSDLIDAGRVSPGETFLDLGTGSGVLGIACCKSGLKGEGLDIDVLAVENALENRVLNHVEDFEVRQGSIDAVPGKTYDPRAGQYSGPAADRACAADRARLQSPAHALFFQGCWKFRPTAWKKPIRPNASPVSPVAFLTGNGAPWCGNNPCLSAL